MLLATLEESVQRSVREATATLHEEIGVLKARLLRAESDDDESDDDSSDSSDDSSTNSLLEDEGMYVPIDCRRNPHYGAADLERNEEFKPKRHDLYGHRP